MYTLDISIKPRKGRRMSGVYLASCLEGRKSRDIPEGARPVSANKRAIMFFLVSSQPVILMIESTSKRGTLPPFFSSCEAIWQRRTKQRDGHTQLNNVSSLGGERLINLCVYMSLFSVCVCVRPETELWWAVGEKGLTQYLNTGRLSHRMEFSFHQLNRFLGLYYSRHTHTQVIWHLRQFAYWERERESSIHPLFSQMFVYSGRSPFFSPLIFFFILNFIRVVRQMVYNYNGITQTIKGGLGVLLLLVCVCVECAKALYGNRHLSCVSDDGSLRRHKLKYTSDFNGPLQLLPAERRDGG